MSYRTQRSVRLGIGFFKNFVLSLSLSLSLDSSRVGLITIGAASAAIFLWLLWFLLSDVTLYERSHAARVEAGAAPWRLSSMVSGKVRDSRLEVGRRVTAGEILLAIDDDGARLRVAHEEATIAGMRSRLSGLRRQLERAEVVAVLARRAASDGRRAAAARLSGANAEYDFAADAASRMQAQAQRGGIAEVDARRSRAEAERARGARDELAADALRVALDGEARIADLQAQSDRLRGEGDQLAQEITAREASLQVARIEAERFLLRAPVDGVIGETTPLSTGALIDVGMRIATIVPNRRLLIVASFDPARTLGRLRAGQQARFKLDAFPWTQFGSVPARVLRVASEPGERGLRVELEPLGGSADAIRLRHGLSGAVEVAVDSLSPFALLFRTAGLAIG